jgi:hypothetical protein
MPNKKKHTHTHTMMPRRQTSRCHVPKFKKASIMNFKIKKNAKNKNIGKMKKTYFI